MWLWPFPPFGDAAAVCWALRWGAALPALQLGLAQSQERRVLIPEPPGNLAERIYWCVSSYQLGS